MLRILLAVTALLLYGSLYPWHFHAGRTAAGPVDALLHSWNFSFNRYLLRDVALNIAIYIPFGAVAYLWLSARRAAVRFAIPVLLATVLSTSIELLQFYDAHRFTSLVDVATNILGAAIGMLLSTTIAHRTAAHISIRQPGALMLLCCFAGALLFPLIPDLSRTHLHQKVAGFLTGGFSSVMFFGLFVSWFTALRLLSALSKRPELLIPLLGLILPARDLVSGLASPWPYWAAFLAAWAVWLAWFGRHPRNSMLAALLLLSVVITGLHPFRFSAAASRFEWVPFRALFSTSWETGFAVFLQKSFLYGSAIWLLREAGLRLRYAAVLVACVLSAIEVAQLFLPNHSAEITDPLMALLLAWLLHRLARAVLNPTNSRLAVTSVPRRYAAGRRSPGGNF